MQNRWQYLALADLVGSSCRRQKQQMVQLLDLREESPFSGSCLKK